MWGELAAATGLLALGGGALYVSPVLFKRRAIAALRRRCVQERALVLTYDDGPGPTTTAQLRELLREFSAKATFFVSGERAQSHPDECQLLLDGGHELASHAFEHRHAFKSTPLALTRDMTRGLALVERMTGSKGPSFRPPYGKLVLPTWLACVRRGVPLAWWTDDSGDSFPELPVRSPALELLERGGGVALLHDLDRSEPRNRFVVETTRALLEGAREKGLEVMTMRELLS